MRSIFAGCLACACAGAAHSAPAATGPFHGRCTLGSHIAQGVSAEDLLNSRSAFSCDTMAIRVSPVDPRRLTILFSTVKGKETRALDFEGQLGPGDLMEVKTASLEPQTPLGVMGGTCEFTLKKGAVRIVTCVANIVTRDQRVVSTVVFEATPPYRPLTP
jgi:hypothetical protein